MHSFVMAKIRVMANEFTRKKNDDKDNDNENCTS